MILNHLQTLLENADTSELLISVVNVILQLTKVYPHVFSEYFRVCYICPCKVSYKVHIWTHKWSATWQNQQNYLCTQRRQISLGIRHPPSLISSLCTQWVARDPSFLHEDSKDFDQTGLIPRLIWVFAGRTCHFLGFVMGLLIYFNVGPQEKA